MYFEDIDDQEGFLRLIGEEVQRRLRTSPDEVLFAEAIRSVTEAMTGDSTEADYMMDSADDIFWAACTSTIAETQYEIGGADTVCVVEFGEGLAFLAFDSNSFRDRGHIIIDEVDPAHKDSIRSQAVDELFSGAGATLEMTPSQISVDSYDTETLVRSALQVLFGTNDGPIIDIDRILGSEMGRYALVGAYLDGVPWNGQQHDDGDEATWAEDEARGMLLSDLLGLDDKSITADLDRIERELRGVREELGDSDSP